MSVYEKKVTYEFEVDGQQLALEDLGEGFWGVEDLRKNGQEDTHMYETVRERNGKIDWVLEDDFNSFAEYESQEQADAILEFLRANGLPKASATLSEPTEEKSNG